MGKSLLWGRALSREPWHILRAARSITCAPFHSPTTLQTPALEVFGFTFHKGLIAARSVVRDASPLPKNLQNCTSTEFGGSGDFYAHVSHQFRLYRLRALGVGVVARRPSSSRVCVLPFREYIDAPSARLEGHNLAKLIFIFCAQSHLVHVVHVREVGPDVWFITQLPQDLSMDGHVVIGDCVSETASQGACNRNLPRP